MILVHHEYAHVRHHAPSKIEDQGTVMGDELRRSGHDLCKHAMHTTVSGRMTDWPNRAGEHPPDLADAASYVRGNHQCASRRNCNLGNGEVVF
jgi:hypothetical protein